MNCKKCGFQLNENDKVCPNCGAEVEIKEEEIQIDDDIEITDDSNNISTNSENVEINEETASNESEDDKSQVVENVFQSLNEPTSETPSFDANNENVPVIDVPNAVEQNSTEEVVPNTPEVENVPTIDQSVENSDMSNNIQSEENNSLIENVPTVDQSIESNTSNDINASNISENIEANPLEQLNQTSEDNSNIENPNNTITEIDSSNSTENPLDGLNSNSNNTSDTLNSQNQVEEALTSNEVVSENTTTQESTPVTPIMPELSRSEVLQDNTDENKPKKKKKNTVLIIIIIIALIGCAAAWYFLYYTPSNQSISNSNSSTNTNLNKTTDDNSTTQENNTNTSENSNSTENGSNNTNQTSNEKVAVLGNYQFTIPNNYLSSTNSSQLLIEDNSNMKANFQIIGDSYNEMKNNLNQATNALVNEGFIVHNADTRVFNNTEFIIFEAVYQNHNIIVFVCKIPNSENDILGAVYDKSEIYNYGSMNTIASIIENVKYVGNSSIDNSNSSIDNVNFDFPTV